MKKALVLSLTIFGFLMITGLTPLFAQDAAAPAAVVPAAPAVEAAAAPAAAVPATEEDKFSFGKVVSIADGVVTVKEYDFTKDADVEVAYTVTAETEFGNINAVADLKAGDDIVIDYLEKEGKRVVTTLVKEEKEMQPAPGEGEAVAPAAAPAAAAPAADAAAPAADEAPAAAPAK